MKRTIIIALSFFIIIGVVALCLNMAMGNQTVIYLQKVRYETIGYINYYYKFDFSEYIKNLNLSITDTSKLTLELPTRQWENMTSVLNWEPLGNDLALILDYVILIINVLIYPLRVGAYLLRNILAILGVNQDTNQTTNGLAWLVQLVNWLVERIAIPYI